MDDLAIHDFFTCNAKISTVAGSIITAPLKLSFVGERCFLYRSLQSSTPIAQAETIGLGTEGATLSLLGSSGDFYVGSYCPDWQHLFHSSE